MRAAVVVQAAWLAAVLVEAPGTHTCPVHESHSAGHGAATTAPAEPAEHGEHLHHPEGEPGDDTGGEHAGCSCLGDCGTTSPVLPIPDGVAATGHSLVQADPPGRPVYDSPRASLHPRLPFANGPPLTTS